MSVVLPTWQVHLWAFLRTGVVVSTPIPVPPTRPNPARRRHTQSSPHFQVRPVVRLGRRVRRVLLSAVLGLLLSAVLGPNAEVYRTESFMRVTDLFIWSTLACNVQRCTTHIQKPTITIDAKLAHTLLYSYDSLSQCASSRGPSASPSRRRPPAPLARPPPPPSSSSGGRNA